MILGVVLGAIVAILITILVEVLRKPKIRIEIGPIMDRRYPRHPAKEVRFLNFNITNQPLTWWAKWMSRNPATNCRATISFHHLDGQSVFGRVMSGRWSKSPEPVPIQVSVENKVILITDPGKMSLDSRMDIFPSETEVLNVVGRFDSDDQCYGWNNESYFCVPTWRNPDWVLPKGRYLVKVEIASSGDKVSCFFRLVNDVSRLDFRLEPAQPSDIVLE